jgi:hypothetical protein
MIISRTEDHDEDQNNKDKKFTTQYTKEELDKIQSDFLQKIRKYFAKVNNSSRMNEVELFPPTNSN